MRKLVRKFGELKLTAAFTIDIDGGASNNKVPMISYNEFYYTMI